MLLQRSFFTVAASVFALFSTSSAQDWYCNFEDKCKECDNSVGGCPADISLWKSQEDCSQKCPEPPDCYICTEQGKCEPGHGLACDITSPLYRQTIDQCAADCAPVLNTNTAPTMYHCSVGDQCIPCQGFECPMDKANFPTQAECQTKCPPEPDCYLCRSGQCIPAVGPMACNMNDLNTFRQHQQCFAGCPGAQPPKPIHHPGGSAFAAVPSALVTFAIGAVLRMF